MNAALRSGRVLWKPALLAAGLLTAGLALQSGWGRSVLDAPAQAGPVVAYAAGLGYGVWAGCALALAAQMGGCTADFLWARLVAREWAVRRTRGRLARLDRQISRYPFGATLTLRLLPVGSNLLLNLLAGVSAVAAGPFLLASAAGYVPQTLVFALLGSGVRVGHTAQLGLATTLFLLSGLLGVWLLRQVRAAG